VKIKVLFPGTLDRAEAHRRVQTFQERVNPAAADAVAGYVGDFNAGRFSQARTHIQTVACGLEAAMGEADLQPVGSSPVVGRISEDSGRVMLHPEAGSTLPSAFMGLLIRQATEESDTSGLLPAQRLGVFTYAYEVMGDLDGAHAVAAANADSASRAIRQCALWLAWTTDWKREGTGHEAARLRFKGFGSEAAPDGVLSSLLSSLFFCSYHSALGDNLLVTEAGEWLHTSLRDCRRMVPAASGDQRDRLVVATTHPDLAASWTTVGRAWGKLGYPQKAFSCGLRAHSLREDDVSLRLLVDACLELGDAKEACGYATRRCVVGNPSAAAFADLGYCALLARDFAEASVNCLRALDMEPQRVDATVNMGVIAEAKSENAVAAKWYRRALSLAPKNPQILRNLKRVEEDS